MDNSHHLVAAFENGLLCLQSLLYFFIYLFLCTVNLVQYKYKT